MIRLLSLLLLLLLLSASSLASRYKPLGLGLGLDINDVMQKVIKLSLSSLSSIIIVRITIKIQTVPWSCSVTGSSSTTTSKMFL